MCWFDDYAIAEFVARSRRMVNEINDDLTVFLEGSCHQLRDFRSRKTVASEDPTCAIHVGLYEISMSHFLMHDLAI